MLSQTILPSNVSFQKIEIEYEEKKSSREIYQYIKIGDLVIMSLWFKFHLLFVFFFYNLHPLPRCRCMY